jgi:hypothetical protein
MIIDLMKSVLKFSSAKWTFLFLITAQFYVTPVFAQIKNVQGIVTDAKGVPMTGVSVTIDGSSTATITDNKGRYNINPSPAT